MVTIAEQEEAYIAKACLAQQSLGLQAASACQYRHSVHRGKEERKEWEEGRQGGSERERGRQTMLIFIKMVCLMKCHGV